MSERKRTIPIVIGGSGYRDIPAADFACVKAAAKAELGRLRAAYPASEIRLLVSLAAGGDTLLAEAAEELGIPFTAVLPLPAEEFLRDFEGEAAEAYGAHLKRADEVLVCPDLEGNADRHALSLQGAGRDYFYRQATLYVARKSHLLIAIWDGTPGAKGGCGTAEAADEALSRPGGAVLQITAYSARHPRAAEAEKDLPKPGETVRRGAYAEAEAAMRRTDAFNAAAVQYDGARYDLGGENGAAEAADPVLARLSEAYASADALSLANAKRYRRILVWMAVLGTAVTVAFLLYDEMELHWMILAMAVMLLLLFAINNFAGKLACHKNYLEYRVFAERLRVQYFLRKAGLARNVNDCIPWAQTGEFVWIERAVDVLTVAEDPAERRSVRTEWLEEQRSYHERAAEKTAKLLKHNDGVQRTALVLTILTFAAALVFEIVWGGLFSGEPRFDAATLDRVRTVVKIAVGGLSAATLFTSNYYGKLSLPRVTQDHLRMERFYRFVLQIAERDGERDNFLVRLAREELIENGNWVSYEQDNAPDISIS